MALSVVNNTSALNAQQNLGRANGALSRSLERLSTGLKVNRGADGPSALVISETQRAQIAGLKTALDNTNKAVSLVQTAEGALNEINGLLVKARSLALDSANSAVNDATAQAANQAEIANILSSIDTIAATTKFGTKNLLNGAASNGLLATSQAGVTTSGTISTIPTQKTFSSFTVATAASKAVATGTATAAFAGAGGTLGAGNAGSIVINGVATALATTDTIDSAVAKFNGTFAANNIAITAANVGGVIRFTANDLKTDVVFAASATAPGAGQSDNDTLVAAGLSTATSGGVTAAGATTATTQARVAATITYVNSLGATVSSSGAVTGTSNGNNGVDAGSVTLTGELAGAIVKLGIDPNNTTSSVTFTNSTFVVGENLTFQTGANAGESSTLAIGRTNSASIGTGSSAASTFTSLGDISVTTATKATAAVTVIDKAISDISSLRGSLGAFQANSLESNSRSLQATLENTTSAESVIRDTDFAEEIAAFTRLQTQVQAGATVLGNANQTTQLVAQLLRG